MQPVEFFRQPSHWTLGESHLHLESLHPTILVEEDNLGKKVVIFAGSTPIKLQELQEKLSVHGNQTRLLPVSMRKDNVCGGVPKLREME